MNNDSDIARVPKVDFPVFGFKTTPTTIPKTNNARTTAYPLLTAEKTLALSQKQQKHSHKHSTHQSD